eukprot:966571_1
MATFCHQSEKACLLLLISFTNLFCVINSNSCIYLHPDHNIEYISGQRNTDPFVVYLGQKLSANECQNSCIDLNYLCDKSIDDVWYDTNSNFEYQFDAQTCAITLLSPDIADSGSGLVLSPDIMSREYIIETQLTITSLWEAGVFWKSNIQQGDAMRDYYFAIDPKTPMALTGYEIPYTQLKTGLPSFGSNHNTKYNLTVHVMD